MPGQKLTNGPGVGKCPAPGQCKICKCPTPGTDKAGKCPAVARKRGGGGVGWVQQELTDALSKQFVFQRSAMSSGVFVQS